MQRLTMGIRCRYSHILGATEKAQGNSIVVFFVTHIFPGGPKLSGGVGLSGRRSGSLIDHRRELLAVHCHC